MYSKHLQQIKDLVVIERILEQLDGQLGTSDKVLAEFLLAQAKQSKNAMDFEQKLAASGAPASLAETLFAIVTKLLPEHFDFKKEPEEPKVEKKVPV